MRPIRDTGGIAIRHLVPPIGKDILLVAVHLSSKLYQDKDDQILYCTRFAQEIRNAERLIGHSRTIVIGDFNMDPFESGIVGAEGLHAVTDSRIVQRGSRVVQGEKRDFFYNPMWCYFGDLSPGPPGTYYYDSGKQVNFFWNMFDQVLIRSALLETFQTESLKIITEIGPTSLLSDTGRPLKAVAVDHLPIVFQLKL